MRFHDLKVWPSFYQDIERGLKTWEWRRDDRNFMVGDVLYLDYFDPSMTTEGGGYILHDGPRGKKHLVAEITYILGGGIMGIPAGYCIMSITLLDSDPG